MFCFSAAANVVIDEHAYVLDVASSSGALLAAACSSGAVRVFAPDTVGGLMAHSGGGPGGGGKNGTAGASTSLLSSFAHTKPATALAWHSGSASLLSASKDGTVACWDVRIGSSGGGKNSASPPPALRLRAGEPLHSVCFVEESTPVSSSASPPAPSAATSTSALVAAGGDGKIFLWDARTGRELCCFEDTHQGDVSCLVRAPTRPTIRADDGAVRSAGGGGGSNKGGGGGSGGACFLSAGVDGLIAVWDVSLSRITGAAPAAAAARAVSSSSSSSPSPDADDEAFVTALNANTSVSRLGLCGEEHLWATTGVEGLLTWDWGAACDEADAAGGVGPSSVVDDARSSLKKKVQGGGKVKGGLAKGASGCCSCDYVVGCVAVEGTSSSSSVLLLAAGDHSGRLALFPLGPPPTRGSAPSLLGVSPMTVPAGSGKRGKPPRGHSATVRAIAAAAPGGRALATGGEDGLVVLWAPGRPSPSPSSNAAAAASAAAVAAASSSSFAQGREGSDDDDDDADDGDDDDNAQRDFSRLRASISGAAGDGLGVIKKNKKKRRHKKKKHKDPGAAVAMALE